MNINADFNARAVVRPGEVPWTPSPMPGVERQMLDRIGDEIARATSIVRYAPGSHFARHVHGGGEEFLVLEGVFSDEHGDYPAGSYLRNPIGTAHSPFSVGGCTIFVKLHQFDRADQAHFAVQTRNADFAPGTAEGLSVLPLHNFGTEQVALVRWQPGTHFTRHTHPGGEEILVLEGIFSDDHGDYPAGSWLRNPPGFVHGPFSNSGCLIWVKTGHLPPRDS
jgi:anti-sigma factor ChrR (cupin superfamily)